MQIYKYAILIILVFAFVQKLYAADIYINDFSELINSNPRSGDILTFTDNLNSDASVGTYFEGLNIIFEGNNYSLDGNNLFSGFTFNRETGFNQVEVRSCRGQRYGGYSYAGAIYNDGGSLSITNSAFNENFVNANGLNLGSGGAIYNVDGGNISINNALFENNYTSGASSYGGAVANDTTSATPTIMTINNSIFRNNYSEGSVLPTGGAIYNTGELQVNNSIFDNNQTIGNDSLASYGGVIYNTGNAAFTNSTITNNSSTGDRQSFVRGGAMYNSGNLTIDNSALSTNSVTADFYGDGGALYNASGATAVIKNSLIENNRINSASGYSEGGGIANEGTVNIENSTFQNNYANDSKKNDIYNYSTGIINFAGSGTTNILSGIAGLGTINKTGAGVLNLGGENSEYTGIFNLQEGSVNLLSGSSYFSAQNTAFYNNTSFNMKNGEINNINFGNLTLNGTSNIFADIDLNTGSMDRINAESINGSGVLTLAPLDFKGTPSAANLSIPFANSVLKDYVRYNPQTIETPIYDYRTSYSSSDGNINFSRDGFNSSVFIPAVSAQIAGYLTQIDTYKRVFSNLDMVMIAPQDIKSGYAMKNKIASTDKVFKFTPLIMPEEQKGVWFKPYALFENVQLKGGENVSNVSYGTILGGESEIQALKRGWYSLYGAYVSYNGSHQTFSGNGIYNNGGLAGIDAAFYKGNFFTIWTANAGANAAEASTKFGSQDFVMFNTGIAEKTGYNWEILNRKLILQPSFLMSYSFINTFNYKTDYNVSINAEPLHAIHIEPQIKIIGNFKNYLQPYISVSMVWNLIDRTNFQANDVYIPSLSVKPFVEYGLGVQKRWGDRLTGFIEGMIRNGGRNGIALLFGIRISI